MKENSSTKHIHDVLHYMTIVNEPLRVDNFIFNIESIFGKDCQFCSCSENVFGIDEVIPFLLSKEKVVISDGKIALKENLQMCDTD